MMKITRDGNSAYVEVTTGGRTFHIKITEHPEGIEIRNNTDTVDIKNEKFGSCFYQNKTDRDKILASNAEGKRCWKEYESI